MLRSNIVTGINAIASKDVSGDGAHDDSRSRPGVPPRISSPKPIVLWLFIFLISRSWTNGQPPKESVERLKADVYYLASHTLEGRGIATPGIELAAQHIRSEFKRLGLKSGTPDGSYYQPFEYGRTSKTAGSTLHNVIGVLEGKGEGANETIIIGAHYDHLGYGEFDSLAPKALRGRIHPGADDNASGISAMLELARRSASHGTPPRRRLVFVAFCAEEVGQIGSRHYASKEPLFPIKDTVAMMNFDMVGRLRNDELGGA